MKRKYIKLSNTNCQNILQENLHWMGLVMGMPKLKEPFLMSFWNKWWHPSTWAQPTTPNIWHNLEAYHCHYVRDTQKNGCNSYIYHTMNDEDLRYYFSVYGTIMTAKVIKDAEGTHVIQSVLDLSTLRMKMMMQIVLRI